MKKIILVSFLAVSLISCTKKYYTNGVVESWQTIEIPVYAENFRSYTDANGLNLYWAADVPVPEITKDIYLNGLVQCYLDYGESTIVLPSVRHNENEYGDFWTQTIDYEYYIGGISFYITNSDFAYIPPLENDEYMLFVLHLLEKH